MSKAPKSTDKKTDRQEKLAAALRENLKRRKAAKQESRKAAKQAMQNPERENDNG
jgi:hypothetical protein